MTELLVHSARLITVDEQGATIDHAVGWLLVRDGVVQRVEAGANWQRFTGPSTEVVDASDVAGQGAVLTPGLIDIHSHGGGGQAIELDESHPAEALETHARHGTTRMVLSLVSAPIAQLSQRAVALCAQLGSNPGFLGVHFEGPFLSQQFCGAHHPDFLQFPTPERLSELLDSGRIVQMTVAPELPGAMELIAAATSRGTRVAIGHTAADAGVARAALDAGASIVTHLFNAMPGLHHRAPGPVGVALIDERAWLELIADGHHIDPTVVALVFQSAPERVVLVSDAMSAAGAPDGHYQLGGQAVIVAQGQARLDTTGVIAGSTLTLDAALRNVVAWGVSLPEAIQAATAAPAAAIGRADLGRLVSGGAADLVIWDADLHARAVWRAAERVS